MARFLWLALVLLLTPETAGFRLRQRGTKPVEQAVKPVVAKAFPANATVSLWAHTNPPACTCETWNKNWKKTTRTTPECVFIDLGAADGNTFQHFMKNGYGSVQNCPGGGAYEAFLVEANPHFDSPLKAQGASNPAKKVHPMPSTAAYMCEGETSFYLDTVNEMNNYWGSSMSRNHPDAQKSGHQKVTVPTTNLIKMIYENTIPGDWVMVKMDIEGAEYEILPCLANAPNTAKLVDRLYLEQHPSSWASSRVKTPDASIAQAIQKLRNLKVDVPDYFSQTL